MAITRRKAISECKRLWKEIEESGKTKYNFIYRSPAGDKWLAKHYQGGCPLCEYSGINCKICPLKTQYGKCCDELGFENHGHIPSTPEWFEAVRGLK